MVFAWVPGNIFPDVLPWLVLLGLLALPRNRAPNAWWIWVPVACGFCFQALLKNARAMVPSQALDILAGTVLALSFGVAALWLLTGPGERKNRFLTFLLTFAIVGGLGLAAYLLAAIANQPMEQPFETFFEGILVLMCGLVIPAALILGGALCRRRYRPVVLLVWIGVWAIVITLVVVLPFLVLAVLSNPGGMAWGEFFVGVSLMAGLSVGILLPFLVLAFANGLFRERLKSLLRLSPTAEPAMIAPPRPLELEVR